MHDFPPFPGFRPAAFDFLRHLARNNQRAWFKPRKETYEDEVRWPLRCLLADAARRAALHKIPLTGDPKGGLFRLYRDTRFSKNKQPYKTYAGAVLSRTGSRKEDGVVYVHVEPGKSFLGAGYWHPEAALLRAWRARMAAEPSAFLEMAHALEAAGLPLSSDGDALKRLPRGYEDFAESDLAGYLRWKSFIAYRTFPDEALQSPDFTEAVVLMMQQTLPLLDYGWQIVDAVPSMG